MGVNKTNTKLELNYLRIDHFSLIFTTKFKGLVLFVIPSENWKKNSKYV